MSHLSFLILFQLALTVTSGHDVFRKESTRFQTEKYSLAIGNYAGHSAETNRKIRDIHNSVLDALSNINVDTLQSTLQLVRSKNINLDSLNSENMETLYRILKITESLSSTKRYLPSLPGIGSILNSTLTGFNGNTGKLLRRVLLNYFTSNMTARISNVLDGKANDLLNLLKNLNISSLNFNPSAFFTAMSVSPLCTEHLLLVFQELTKGTMWALRMLDATGRPRSGLLNGNTFWPGSYDQCLNIKVDDTVTNRSSFSTHHCMVKIPILSTPEITRFFELGTCIPDTCSEQDLLILSNAVLAKLPTQNFTIAATVSQCSSTETVFDAKAIFALCTCGLVMFLVLIGTCLDIIFDQLKKTDSSDNVPNHVSSSHCSTEQNGRPFIAQEREPVVLATVTNINAKRKNYKMLSELNNGILHSKCSAAFVKFVLAFSLWTNGRKLLNTKQTGTLGAINGIRFLSMTWIILGHTYGFGSLYVENIVSAITQVRNRWTYMAIANSFVAVDTFFTMSGFLLSYVFFNMMKKMGKMNWFMFYFHRYWRLTPVYLFIMMIHITLFRYFGDGPLWNKDGLEDNYCRDTWWYNVLYINNFITYDKICMVWTWYLSNEMQFYVISPLLLVPLFYWKKLGILVSVTFLLAVTITTTLVSIVNDLPVTFFQDAGDGRQIDLYYKLYYVRPYCRMGPYIVGIITGFVFHQTGTQVKINRYLRLFAWILTTGLVCVCVYATYGPVSGTPFGSAETAIYNATSRTLWGVCVCWVIFACATGNGGFVNTVLSWSPFVLLSRLTYCVYLIHPIIINVFYLNMRQYGYASDLHDTWQYCANLMLSYLLGFVVCLFVESPILAIEKLLFRQDQKDDKKTVEGSDDKESG